MPEISENELPADVKSLWFKAINAVQASNHEYAITLIQGILAKAPGFLEGRRMLRKCELQFLGETKRKAGLFGSVAARKIQGQLKKNPAEAMILAEKELAKDPTSDHVNDLLHEAALRMELPETAAFALETIRKVEPENSRILHKLATYYMQTNQPHEAVEVYNDIIQHHPTDGAAIKGSKDASARASMQRQNWNEDTNMRALLRHESEAAELEMAARTGMTHEQLMQRRDDAIERYNADNNNLAACRELAFIYEQMEDWHNSYSFYSWAHSLSNGDSTLAKKASEMNDKAIEQDLQELEAALEADPDNEELREALKSRRADRLKEQITECRQRVEANPTDAHLRFELGTVLFRAKEYSEAIPHLQQATRNPHIRTKVLLILARCFKAKSMYDLAVKQLSDALADLQAMDGTKKEVLYEKGLIHGDMGDEKAALDSFKQIYEVDYGYRDVAQRVESSYSK